MRTVMAFGTFDLLHLGHLRYLGAAKKFGDRLVVVVARDATVRRLKGGRPFFSERERLEFVKALRVVDEAVLGGRGDRFQIIRRMRPAVVVLGYDQEEDAAGLEKWLAEGGLRTRVVRLKAAYKPRKHKSSVLRKVGGGRRSRFI